ncbi:hypothetical protein GPA19_08140 [Azoarcus indigens]|uniref:Uncharacterized protein n=1 Tax=Azoarcus indigens TaxID=29545 RepID=A0A4R6DYN7_9RHOO|nr:hypothetical protein [Azoarcus indigens]NMG64914.1 hypothetical protein [Azoarcus indigens]TDN50451.1 hypothetical protein C7389_109145 [Azoarcus indigens]
MSAHDTTEPALITVGVSNAQLSRLNMLLAQLREERPSATDNDLADAVFAAGIDALEQAQAATRPSAPKLGSPTAGKNLGEWAEGVLMAVSVLVATHDEPTAAADVLNELGLSKADCSGLDDFDKTNLRKIMRAGRGKIALTGLRRRKQGGAT